MPDVSPEPVAAPPAPTDTSATDQTAPSGDTQSVLATIRELRSHLGSQATPYDIPVPGYKGILVLRNKWVPYKTLSENAKNLKGLDNPTDVEIAAAADLLTLTCQEVLIKVEGELRPLSQTDSPVTFSDPRLPELIGAPPVTTAREAVSATFKNDYAVIDTANAVVAWLRDTSVQADKEALGN